jgi:hypothetical protein
VTELSKNGFNVTLDSSLMNNLGTAVELGKKVLADTDWEVDGEHIVATQDEALVMLLLPTNLANYKIYKIDDTNTASTLSATEVADKSSMSGKPIYVFYSCCTGSKPYRF